MENSLKTETDTDKKYKLQGHINRIKNDKKMLDGIDSVIYSFALLFASSYKDKRVFLLTEDKAFLKCVNYFADNTEEIFKNELNIKYPVRAILPSDIYSR